MKPKFKDLKQKEEEQFINLTPRRGSLPADYNRSGSPRFSPKLPLTAPLPEEPNTDNFNKLLEGTDYGSILDNLLTKGQTSSDNLLNKLLDQKENDLRRLEAEKTQLLQKEQELEKEKQKTKQLEKTLLKKNKKFEELKSELKNTEDDLLQVGEEKDELNHLLVEEKLNNRKLEKRLEQEINENDWLRASFKQTKEELTQKAEELTKLKKLEKQEKEEWTKIFIQQEEKYEKEKKEREKVFSKQINNLRTFQLTADIPLSIGRGRGLHKKSHSLSLPSSRSASPRGSTHEQDPLLFELNKVNRFNPLTSSPLRNEDIDPFQETSTSNFDFNQFTDLLDEVDSFASECNTVIFNNIRENTQQEQDNQGLLEENQQLKAQIASKDQEKLALERNYKTLADERVINERLLQEFNQKELVWEKEKKELEKLLFNYTQKEQTYQQENQSLKEELSEVKYQLAETKSKKNLAEKAKKEFLTNLETETDGLNSIIQENQDLLAELEAKIEVNINKINTK